MRSYTMRTTVQYKLSVTISYHKTYSTRPIKTRPSQALKSYARKGLYISIRYLTYAVLDARYVHGQNIEAGVVIRA